MRHLADGAEPLDELAIFEREVILEPFKVDDQRGEGLPSIIMQTAGDSDAFLLLSIDGPLCQNGDREDDPTFGVKPLRHRTI